MTAKQKNVRSMGVAKRTRNQVALREKELREKNSGDRLDALGKHRKLCAEKKRNRPTDKNGEEGVKVVSEAEYMKWVSRLENRESSPSRDVAFEGNIHDNDDVENVGNDHHSDTSVGYESPTRERGYRDGDGFSERHHSMMVSDDDISTEEDDNSSDDDFRVDDERWNIDSSGESGEHDDYVDDSLKDMRRRRVNADKNMDYRGRESVRVDNSMEDIGRASVLDDIVVGDEEYMQWLGNEYGVDKSQTESPKDAETEILGFSDDAEFEAPENIDVEIGNQTESPKDIETEILGCSHTAEFEVPENIDVEIGNQTESPKDVETVILGCYDNAAFEAPEDIDVEIGTAAESFDGSENAGSGKSCKKAWIKSESESEKGGSRRTRQTERVNVVVSTASDDDDDYVKWISSQYGMNITRDESHRKTSVEIKSEPENDLMSENVVSFNSVDRQRGQLPESKNVGIKPKIEHDWPEELRSARNGSNKKRGRTATAKNVVEECEASSYAHSSSSPYAPSYKNSGYGKRRKSDFENIGCSGNSKERMKKFEK